MQHVLLEIGICHLLILDVCSHFKLVFIVMCKALNINCNIFAKRNHKGIFVDNVHRFIKKAITIAAKNKGEHNIFVVTCVAAGNA